MLLSTRLLIAGGRPLPRGAGPYGGSDGVLPGVLPACEVERRAALRAAEAAQRRPDEEADRLRQGVRGVLPPAVRHLQVGKARLNIARSGCVGIIS